MSYHRPTEEELKSQSVRNALRDLGLSRVELAVALVLLDRVSWKSWKTETKDGQPMRLSVRYIARQGGYGRRQARRGLRSLELRGLILVDGGVYQANLYEVVVEKIMHWVMERRGQPQLAVAHSAEDLEAVRVPRADAGRARRLAEAAAEAEAGVEHPSWAVRAASQYHRPVALVLDVVRQIAAAVLGAGEHELGPLTRPALRLWDRLGRPTAAEAARRVRLVVSAAQEDCTEQALLSLRGLRRVWKRHPNHGPSMVRVERFADDHIGNVSAVCALGSWAARVQAAERHVAGTCTCGAHAPVQARQEPSQAPPTPDELHGMVRAGAAVEDARRRWAKASAALREQLGDSDWQVWLKPLKVAGVAQGSVVIVAPNLHYVDWVVRHYGARLEELVGAPLKVQARQTPAPPPDPPSET